MIKTTVSGVDEVKRAIEELAKEFDLPTLTVGIHEDAADPDGGQITMAGLGATHEFGADINHPGGTSYGYASNSAAEKGQVRFLKAGSGFMELGVTGPHQIKIPARPWLQPGFDSGMEEYQKIMERGIKDMEKGGSLLDALKRVGAVAVGKVQQYMTNLKTPANAPSTVAKKGSANPLIDSGVMRSSVNYQLQVVKPEEGL